MTLPPSWSYPPELVEALATLGVSPTKDTPPALARGAVDDLYRYELRRLRNRLRSGQVERANYLEAVVALRKKYWMLTLPLPAWEKITSSSEPSA